MKKIIFAVIFVFMPVVVMADAVLGKVNGMICIDCQNKIVAELEKQSGVIDVKMIIVSWPDAIAIVNLDEKSNFSAEKFINIITSVGFTVEKAARIEGKIDSLEIGIKKLKEI